MLESLSRQGELPNLLHLGSGHRRVRGWLNVDISGSDVDVDLAAGHLPFPDGHFSAVCSQHVIEHLHLIDELEPLMLEVFRVMQPGGDVYLSCPDIKKLCESYLEHGCEDLVEDRLQRVSKYTLNGYPASHFLNDMFHQQGQHKNLFDFPLLAALLEKSGFSAVEEITEKDLLDRFPGFPERRDGKQTLYVRARR
jgi:predicted SAM-dependent methyltransferase